MKLSIQPTLSCLVAIVVAACSIQSANAQQMPAASPEHDVLKHEVGVWDSVMSMESPEGNIEVKGVEKNEMLSPMWLSSTLEYDMFGQTMKGHGVFGYDPEKKKYIGSWHDGSSPFRTMMEGTWDESTKTFTYAMKSRDPMTGKKQDGKIVIQFKGEDKKVFTMYVENPEKKGEMSVYFTMKYTKRK